MPMFCPVCGSRLPAPDYTWAWKTWRKLVKKPAREYWYVWNFNPPLDGSHLACRTQTESWATLTGPGRRRLLRRLKHSLFTGQVVDYQAEVSGNREKHG